jgi:predicted nucleic acid-binding protein
MTSSNPKKVVFSPEVVALGILNATCREVLVLWKRGLIRPAVSMELLGVYGKLFKKMGLPQNLTKEWLVWLSRSITTDRSGGHVDSLDELLIQTMVESNAESIITFKSRTIITDGLQIESVDPDSILSQFR